MNRFENKFAVITGGNSGIGLATARAFIDEGARVLITGRNAETLASAEDTLGDRATAIRADVTKLPDLDRVFAAAREHTDRIDALFVNAGIAKVVPFDQTDEATYDAIMDTNVKGAYFTVQKALPLLGKGSSVVFNTSVAGSMGFHGFSVYGPTKAALRGLARVLAVELSPLGIRANAVAPGPIETPLWGRVGLPEKDVQEMGGAIGEKVPMGRFGSAAEVAAAVLFLSSDESSYIQGAELPVGGGIGDV